MIAMFIATIGGILCATGLAFAITMFLVYKSNDTDNREPKFEDFTGQRMKELY